MKIIKFNKPGVVIIRQGLDKQRIDVEKGHYMKIEISDKPFEQKPSHEKHKPDKKPDQLRPPKNKITLKDLVMFMIIAALLGTVISLLSGNETVQQEKPKLIPNNYELLRSY